jgi:streptogramin lyase
MKKPIAVAGSDHGTGAPIGPFRRGGSHLGLLRLAFVCLAAVALLAVGAGSVAAEGMVSNYTGPGINQPSGIALGPDGALWFTNRGGNSIGRITTSGVVSNYTNSALENPEGIALGPDGALWFTNSNSIGRITTSGGVSTYTGIGISDPRGIAAGPDGALWFTNFANFTIGRITISGEVSNYRFTPFTPQQPKEIALGPDGALWFTTEQGKIGRITTSGVTSFYTDPGIYYPNGITAGPDGALWFANNCCSIGRITTSGVVSTYSTNLISGAPNGGPHGIAAGPDGALWFTNRFTNTIGRITTSGVVSEYTGTGISEPWGIALGPDGALWFTNSGNNSIGRIGVVATIPATVTLSPATATNPVGTSHTVTATVDAATGQPVPNTTVKFTVTGAVNTTGSCTTGPTGTCSFTYYGPTFPGADAITGCAGASGTPPCGTATKTWVLPVSTPGCATLITNGAWIIADNGDQATFGGSAHAPSSGPPSGQEQYTDHGPLTPMDVHSLNVLAIVCNADNTQADMYGQATINQAGSHYYRISVADPDPTAGADRYRIRLDTGYDSGDHTLGGGNIEIHR